MEKATTPLGQSNVNYTYFFYSVIDVAIVNFILEVILVNDVLS